MHRNSTMFVSRKLDGKKKKKALDWEREFIINLELIEKESWGIHVPARRPECGNETSEFTGSEIRDTVNVMFEQSLTVSVTMTYSSFFSKGGGGGFNSMDRR